MALCRDKQADLWIARENGQPFGVCVAQVLAKPKANVLNILALGGESGARWLRLGTRTVIEDAKLLGATRIMMVRLAGKRTFLGRKPKGYYYEEEI